MTAFLNPSYVSANAGQKAWAGVSLDDFPHLNAWLERVLAHPGIEKGRHNPKRHTALDMKNQSKEELDKAAKEAAKWVQAGMKEDAQKK